MCSRLALEPALEAPVRPIGQGRRQGRTFHHHHHQEWAITSLQTLPNVVVKCQSLHPGGVRFLCVLRGVFLCQCHFPSLSLSVCLSLPPSLFFSLSPCPACQCIVFFFLSFLSSCLCPWLQPLGRHEFDCSVLCGCRLATVVLAHRVAEHSPHFQCRRALSEQ